LDDDRIVAADLDVADVEDASLTAGSNKGHEMELLTSE
jgi:hypothetical protein